MMLNKFNIDNDRLGMQVTLYAVLVITNTECVLVPKNEDKTSSNKIEIFFPNLECLLDEVVGGWVGSDIYYMDEVVVTGFLDKGTRINIPFSISQISNFILKRDGDEYKIL